MLVRSFLVIGISMELLWLFAAGALMLIVHSFWSRTKKDSSVPKGNSGWPVVGESFALLLSSPTEFLVQRSKRFGEVFASHLFGAPTIVTTTADAIRFFLNSPASKKCKQSEAFKVIIGPNTVNGVDGEAHTVYRRIILSSLVPEMLKHHVNRIDHLATKILDSWSSESDVLTSKACIQFSYDVITGFLCEQLQEVNEGTQSLMKDVVALEKGLLQLPLNIPFTPYYYALLARKRIHVYLDKLISQRRTSNDVYKDVVQEFLQQRDELGQKLTNKQIEDNMIAMLFAGHHTTAATLVFLIKFLRENPEFLEEIKEEQYAILNSKSSRVDPVTWEDTRKMTATVRAFQETQRLTSVVEVFTREIIDDVNYKGYKLPKGWNLQLHIATIHLNEEIYPDALKFNPARFKAPPKQGTFVPFGFGPRVCAGSELAKLEVLIFIHRLVTKYSWEPLNPKGKMKYWPMAYVEDGYPITVKPVNA